MLAGDEARARLAGHTAPDDEQRRGVRVRKRFAPPLAHDIAAALDGRVNSWRGCAEKLDRLSLGKREKVLAALSPELGKDLAFWWEWSAGQPYQRGWGRRAFRSSDPADSLEARWHDLRSLLHLAVRHPKPLEWYADWVMHVGQYTPLGSLLASSVDHGRRDVFDTMAACLRGDHPVSGPAQHVYVALLSASDPQGWAQVEQLLVSAQRAEGLRQTILEAADLAHPDAFARVLDLVVEHRLARFAGTVRALGVWVGEELNVRQEKPVAAAITAIRDRLRQPPTVEALSGADPVETFLGVWSLAVRDVHQAIPVAEALLDGDDERTRLAAARLLKDFSVAACGPGLERALADTALPVYAAAVEAWPAHDYGPRNAFAPLTDAARAGLRERVAALGKVQEVETGLIGERPRKISGPLAADLLVCHADGPLDPELVAAATADGRAVAARAYAKDPQAHRAALFSMLADRSSVVRDRVSEALQSLPGLTEDEALIVEKTLTRKAADVRTNALTLLRQQEPEALRASVARLSDGTADQQRAAEELGQHARGEQQASVEAPAAVRFSVADRTPAERPVPPARRWAEYHENARLILSSLRAWLDEHADTEVQTGWGVELLANLRYLGASQDGRLPLPQITEPWWERVAPQLTDGGVEAALLTQLARTDRPWARELLVEVAGPAVLEFVGEDTPPLLWDIVREAAVHAWRDSWADPLLDLLETVAVRLPLDGLVGPAEVLERRGRRLERDQWGNIRAFDERGSFDWLFAGSHRLLDPERLSDDQLRRLWRALRYVDEPEGTLDRWDGPLVEVEARGSYGRSGGTVRVPDQPQRWPISMRLLVAAFERGVATDADVLDALLPIHQVRSWYSSRNDRALWTLTGVRPEEWASGERVQAVVARFRAAVVDAETSRGDLPGPLSEAARGLRSTDGAEQLTRCLAALGKRPFARGYTWTPSRESSLSHLVRVNQPSPGDTVERLGELVEAAKITDQRLVETAVYAPQWSNLIEQRLGWSGLESAVWWVHAHTKDEGWDVDQAIRARWATEVSQRTPLEASDLVRGAADVQWFRAVVDTLGEERFAQVLKAAKYASSSGGHKRAELFATALLGQVDAAAVAERIAAKRHQDSVRALGLVPLADQQELLDRYELLRGFVASDRTSGSQRRASETTAVEVGMENLARTAGFRDPQRLVWAMEAAAVRDLAQGPVTAEHDDLVVSLSLDASGSPQLDVARAGKTLKSIPAKSAKIPEIAALKQRARSLRSQAKRMRASLEAACVLGDAFEGSELDDLLGHPILAPMLRDLVLVDEEGRVGFPVDGRTLASAEGEERAASGALRIAHPVDLSASGEWPEFQHALMVAGRRQTFKQVFRELYTLNANERDEEGVASRRYSGHQVQARQANGVFGSRGWVADFESGLSRTFHQQKITVWCHLVNGWGSPTEVEDATVEDVTFHPAGEWRPMPLSEVPPRVFSEAMRDLDLVVSVAHSAGVDPETSESSVRTRGRLVEETCDLLGLSNVEVGGHHVRVKGTLGTYSIHLGSGVVHRIPGNAVCIVPVSAQHRGRIFLPFADDDPRTAEIVAKVVLLARDEKIKDPTILQQLVG
ncbi:MAG: DUF5724 domain-containing protein [Aeromicrobium sp.]|uniref:DUF5724 domain-containing protein n=1 Tax=Aeromicrobium sp. TaxID=1871063 RepID=UPI0039E25DC6